MYNPSITEGVFCFIIISYLCKMENYKVVIRENGEILESGLTLIEATELVNSYVREDKHDERYIPNFYQIIPEKKFLGNLDLVLGN